MACTEINTVGNFDTWAPSKLAELQKIEVPDSLGQNLLVENDYVLNWEVMLFPDERLPFRKIHRDYSAVSLIKGGAPLKMW